ncbi:MAG TPA: hypothetical protein VGN29_18115 [Solirubrobacteraceae bacterium]|nr:hypothetical protein [Solirubrobacteraceae bacterium]
MRTENELAEWTRAAGLTDILTPELLGTQEVRFLAARDEHGTGLRAAIAAGFSDLGPLRVWLAP